MGRRGRLLPLFLLLLFQGCTNGIDPSPADADADAAAAAFDAQLLDNVHPRCHSMLKRRPTLLAALPSDADADEITVVASPPSHDEVAAYAGLPATLTKANAALAKGEVLGKSKVAEWKKSGNNWQLPRNHLRNDKDRCVNASVAASQGVVALYSDAMKNDVSAFYLLHLRNALVHPTGVVATRCGYIQAHEACETIFRFLGKKWFAQCQAGIAAQRKGGADVTWESAWDGTAASVEALHRACRDADTTPTTTNSKVTYQGDPAELTPDLGTPEAPPQQAARYRRVFVISAGWDSNFHHFLVDSLSRLIRHLPFLRAHPDIRIHIRATDNRFRKVKLIEAGRRMRARLFAMLGLDLRRLVAGTVYADEVFVPKGTRCNAPLSLAYDLRSLVSYLMRESFPETASPPAAVTTAKAGRSRRRPEPARARTLEGPAYPGDLVKAAVARNTSLARLYARQVVVILHRRCATNAECDKGWRDWDDTTAAALAAAFQRAFPALEVVLLGPDAQDCLQCQIRLLAHAAVLVGTHGAGITNLVFMPPGGLVVEVVAGFDGRMLPLCGYHGPLAAVFGVHHYVFYYDWKLNAQTRKALDKATGRRAVAVDADAIAQEAKMFHREILDKRRSAART